jgi:hypothetical protein
MKEQCKYFGKLGVSISMPFLHKILMKRFYIQWTQKSGENFLGLSSLPTTNSPFYIILSNILTHRCII